MSKEPPVEGEVVKGEITPETKDNFIPEVGGIIKQEGGKYATITINKQVMKYLFDGLGKYREGFVTNSVEDVKGREEIDQLVKELTVVNDILNEEVVVPKFGQQEPNPVNQTEGTIE